MLGCGGQEAQAVHGPESQRDVSRQRKDTLGVVSRILFQLLPQLEMVPPFYSLLSSANRGALFRDCISQEARVPPPEEIRPVVLPHCSGLHWAWNLSQPLHRHCVSSLTSLYCTVRLSSWLVHTLLSPGPYCILNTRMNSRTRRQCECVERVLVVETDTAL